MTITYRVIIKGFQPGVESVKVTEELAKLLKTTDDKARGVLSTPGFCIKKGLDTASAERYLKALAATGANVVVESETPVKPIPFLDPAEEQNLEPVPTPVHTNNLTTKACVQCGFELPASANFCRQCGCNQKNPGIPNPHVAPPAVKRLPPVLLAGGAIVAIALVAGGWYIRSGTPAQAAPVEMTTKAPTPAAAPVPARPAPVVTETAAPVHLSTVKTSSGDLTLYGKNEVDGTKTQMLLLDGKQVLTETDVELAVEKQFDLMGRSVVLLSVSTGGNACPAMYRFVTISKTGAPSVTESFGTCSDLPRLSVADDAVTIALPDLRGNGEDVWKLTGTTLTQIKKAGTQTTDSAARIKPDDNMNATITGTLVREVDNRVRGKPVEYNALRLAHKSIIEDCDSLGAVVESIPILDHVVLPAVQGQADFNVTLACSNAGGAIESFNGSDKGVSGAVTAERPPPQVQDALTTSAAQCDSLTSCTDAILASADPDNPAARLAATARIDELVKPTRGDRKLARELNKQGLEAFNSNNLPTAIELLKKAASTDPSDVEIQSNLGFVALRADLPDVAAPAIANALMIDPRRTSAWAPRAELESIQGHPDIAVRALLVAFAFSANQGKTVAFYEDKASTALRESMRPLYGTALQKIKTNSK